MFAGLLSARKQALKICNIWHFEVRVHILWPIFLGVQILFIALSDFSKKGEAIAWVALLYGPILFLSILINALGACYATRSIGGSFTEVIFVPLGFAFTCEHDEGPRKDIWAQLLGPLTHLPQAGLWAVFSIFTYHAWTGKWTTNVDFDMWYDRNSFGHSLMIAAMWLNISLFILNVLIPAVPLNGSRILADILLIANVPIDTIAWTMVGLSGAIGIAMIVLGALHIWGGYFGIFIGIWIVFATFQLFRLVQAGQAHRHSLFWHYKEDAPPDAVITQHQMTNQGKAGNQFRV